MPALVIPGINSSYKTDKIIEDLMKVERLPLDKKQREIEAIKSNKKSWQGVNAQLSRLENSSKRLFGFENPFEDKIAESQDNSVLTATANRNAEIQNLKIKVKQLAKADRLKTPPLSNKYKVPKGKYTFGVGEKKVTLYYKGGTLKDFASTINKKGKDLVKASVVRVTGDSEVFILESQLSGEKNILKLSDNARKLAIETGMITNSTSGESVNKLLENYHLKTDEKKSVSVPNLSEKDGKLTIRYHFESAKKKDEPSKNEDINPDSTTGNKALIPISGSVTVEDVTVFQAPSESGDTTVPPPENQSQINKNLTSKNEIIVLNRITGTQPVENITPSPDNKELVFDINNYKDLQSIDFTNIYKDIALVIDSVEISDGVSRDYTPINPISIAQDAIVEMNGLEATRPSNQIDDLAYGVNLNLKKASDEEIEIEVQSDVESIKNSIYDYVFNYNKTIESILVLTSNDPKVVEELVYLEDSEKEALLEQLGSIQGDLTLRRIKDRLRTISASAYKASPESKVNLLTDLGIGTNISGSVSYDRARLRGYLQMDEKKLEKVINENIKDVKNFFGVDSNDDMIVDNGMAFHITNSLKPYTATGGIIFNKTNMFDRKVATLEKESRNLETKLKKTEQNYKVKFGKMESMIEDMQKNTKTINNLNN